MDLIDHILLWAIAIVSGIILHMIAPPRIIGKKWGIRKGPSTLDEDKEENDG